MLDRRTSCGIGDGSTTLLALVKRGQKEPAMNLVLTVCEESGFARRVLERQDELHDGAVLFWACSRGYEDLVDVLLTLGAKVNSRTQNGATPLHAASDRGRLTIARRLVEWGADVGALTLLGETACHLAAYNGHTDVVSLLISSGSDSGLRNWRGNDVFEEALAGSHPQSANSILRSIQAHTITVISDRRLAKR